MLKLYGHTYLHPKELDQKTRTFLAILINDFGFSMVAILIPVFLWQEGYNLLEISLFHIALFAFRSFTSAVAIRIAWVLGNAKALQIGFLSGLLGVGSMVLLTTLPELSYGVLGVAAVVNGISAGLYWVPRHLSIESITTNHDAGQVATRMRMLETMMLALGPLTGGVVAAYFGSEYALTLAFMVILISTAYVLSDRKTIKAKIYNKKDIYAGDIKFDIIGNLARGYDMGLALAAWPLLIYIVTGDIALVGAIGTISGLLLIPLMLFVSKKVDGQEKQFLSTGILIRSIAYPLRAVAGSFYTALGVNILADIGDVQAGAGHMGHYYKRANSLSRVRYTYYMEIVFPIGGAIAWMLIALFTLYFSAEDSLRLAFISAVLIIPFTLFYIRQRRRY